MEWELRNQVLWFKNNHCICRFGIALHFLGRSVFHMLLFSFFNIFFWRASFCGVNSLVTWMNQESGFSFFYNCNQYQCFCMCAFKSIWSVIFSYSLRSYIEKVDFPLPSAFPGTRKGLRCSVFFNFIFLEAYLLSVWRIHMGNFS